MNNYCRNCGNIINPALICCDKCGAEIFTKRVNPEEKKRELELQKKKEIKAITAIVVLFALSYFLPLSSQIVPYNIKFFHSLISIISPLLIFSAIIVLIYSRITLRGSKIIRVLFLIFVILAVLHLLFFLLIMIACKGIFGGW